MSHSRTITLSLYLLNSLALCACHAQESRPAPNTARPLVGAIRWDAWTGQRGDASRAVHRTLTPEKWRYRLPFYAKALADGAIEIDGTPQAVVDREIEYAADAGLDYWAFVTYSADDPLSIALDRYLTSRLRERIDFCLITECSRWRDPAYVERVLRLMREPGYQTVREGRPLLYFAFIKEEKLAGFGGIDGLHRLLDEFRTRAQKASLKHPYVVIMDFYPPHGRRWADALGCDAISSYATGWHHGRVPYARWASKTESFWDECRQTGAQVVPILMTGWDPRPRVETPVPWGEAYQTHNGQVDHSSQAKPTELAAHLQNALAWLAAHRADAQAQTAIIYAWNEFDEGGWLCPTLSESTARLDAIRPVLRPSPSPTSMPAPPVAATRP